jgi:hypothetical protein
MFRDTYTRARATGKRQHQLSIEVHLRIGRTAIERSTACRRVLIPLRPTRRRLIKPMRGTRSCFPYASQSSFLGNKGAEFSS